MGLLGYVASTFLTASNFTLFLESNSRSLPISGKLRKVMFSMPFGGSPAGSAHYHQSSHFEKRRQSAGNLSVAAQRRRKRMMTRTPWTSAGTEGEGSSATRLLSKFWFLGLIFSKPRFCSLHFEWNAFYPQFLFPLGMPTTECAWNNDNWIGLLQPWKRFCRLSIKEAMLKNN